MLHFFFYLLSSKIINKVPSRNHNAPAHQTDCLFSSPRAPRDRDINHATNGHAHTHHLSTSVPNMVKYHPNITFITTSPLFTPRSNSQERKQTSSLQPTPRRNIPLILPLSHRHRFNPTNNPHSPPIHQKPQNSQSTSPPRSKLASHANIPTPNPHHHRPLYMRQQENGTNLARTKSRPPKGRTPHGNAIRNDHSLTSV